jgi:hypothetical protein
MIDEEGSWSIGARQISLQDLNSECQLVAFQLWLFQHHDRVADLRTIFA